jgi:hypothetical protein
MHKLSWQAGQWGEADFSDQEQMVIWLDEGLVYCKVPRHLCEQGGKTVHILRSYMCSLEFRTKPPFDYADNDSGDVAFV